MDITYRKTFLNRRLRRAIMIILIFLFFMLSPLLIFHGSGYRYDWKNEQIESTGVLSVDASPSDSVVTLAGKQINGRLPLSLPNLDPGAYRVTISRKGYRAWQGDIAIAKHKTTYVSGISLAMEASPTATTTVAVPFEHSYNFSRFDPKNKIWLTWSLFELRQINANGSISLVNRFGEKILDAWPMGAGQAILIAHPTSLVAYYPSYGVSQTLLKDAIIEQTSVDAPNRTIYFSGEVGANKGLFELAY